MRRSERSLGKLGGLIHRMPWVAWLALVGTLAIAGLPPLNGFVSEWLLLQAFLFTPEPAAIVHQHAGAGGRGGVALAAALAAYVMVKFYGVIFLGQPREPGLACAQDAGCLERFGMAWLAAGCFVLGLFPGHRDRDARPDQRDADRLHGGPRDHRATGCCWRRSTPTARATARSSCCRDRRRRAADDAGSCTASTTAACGAPPWDCGFPLQTPRMQDTAEGFGQPIRQVFEPFFRIERQLPSPFDAAPRYAVIAGDHFWYWLYLPIARAVDRPAPAGAASSRAASRST